MTCNCTLCFRETPDGYEYCDDHYQLRDRDGDDPGTMDTLDGTRSAWGQAPSYSPMRPRIAWRRDVVQE